jgi:phosphatidylserine decarboxylase
VDAAKAPEGGARTPGQRLFVALQRCLPQHLLSRAMHALAGSEVPLLKNLGVRCFLAAFHPDMSEAAQPDPYRYPSFNGFFTRALAPGARPIDLDPAALICPVDGTVSQIGRIEDGRLPQAKGHTYTVEALLASPEWAQRFAGGHFATIYLAPYNYHRIHAPLASRLCAAWHTPGSLFSVNAVTAAAIPQLFARNERVSCVLQASLPGAAPLSYALVLVGALLVGSIQTVWHGQITPRRVGRSETLPLSTQRAALQLAKGAELGRFNMGSTVILLLPAGVIEWLPGLSPGSPVRMGQMLGRLGGRPPAGAP